MQDLVHEILGTVVNDQLGTQRFHECCLFLPADGGGDEGAEMAGDLDGHVPHAAGSRMNQHRMADVELGARDFAVARSRKSWLAAVPKLAGSALPGGYVDGELVHVPAIGGRAGETGFVARFVRGLPEAVAK